MAGAGTSKKVEFMIKVLSEISEAKGRYSEDRLTHALNTIQDMQELANNAITKLTDKEWI